MQLQRLELFSTKREFLAFLGASFFILFYALLIEYNNYKILTHFDTAFVDAEVIKQYTKTKLTKLNKKRIYQVLKLKADGGYSFYTTASKKLQDIKGKKVRLEIWAGKISFYEYMSSFYAYSHIKDIENNISLKQNLNQYIDTSHINKDISSIYKALYTATPLTTKLQTKFSNLGVSHLLAISGFHLGVLATVLFFIFKMPYKFLQQRYFPYRSYTLDSFIFISIVLLGYLLFLGTPPSLLRAYAMLLIGFFLYDRGYKIVSMQTLFLTIILLLAFFPRLFFSIGFWLSISGVFYIFLFLIHFKRLNKIWQFVLVPFWVYVSMLPFSLYIFGNFSLYHPLSILWTSLFTLFYPLSIVAHLLSFGALFDSSLEMFLNLPIEESIVDLSLTYFGIHIILSLLSVLKREFAYLLLIESIIIFSLSYRSVI